MKKERIEQIEKMYGETKSAITRELLDEVRSQNRFIGELLTRTVDLERRLTEAQKQLSVIANVSGSADKIEPKRAYYTEVIMNWIEQHR